MWDWLNTAWSWVPSSESIWGTDIWNWGGNSEAPYYLGGSAYAPDSNRSSFLSTALGLGNTGETSNKGGSWLSSILGRGGLGAGLQGIGEAFFKNRSEERYNDYLNGKLGIDRDQLNYLREKLAADQAMSAEALAAQKEIAEMQIAAEKAIAAYRGMTTAAQDRTSTALAGGQGIVNALDQLANIAQRPALATQRVQIR